MKIDRSLLIRGQHYKTKSEKRKEPGMVPAWYLHPRFLVTKTRRMKLRGLHLPDSSGAAFVGAPGGGVGAAHPSAARGEGSDARPSAGGLRCVCPVK